MKAHRNSNRGFTLVEILIVVIILGILAAIVIPQFTNASEDARKSSLTSQLQTIRSQIELYKLQHRDEAPLAFDDDGTIAGSAAWAQMIVKTNDNHTTTGTPTFGPYLQAAPANNLRVGTAATAVEVVANDAAVAAVATDVGWIYSQSTGKIWARAGAEDGVAGAYVEQ